MHWHRNSKLLWEALIDWLVETSCLKLAMISNCIGILLILFFYVLDIMSNFALGAIITVFSAIPAHFKVSGYCESWKRERKE